MALTVRNPASGAVVAELAEADPKAVAEAVARARAAQPAWAARPLAERAGIVGRFQALLLDHRADVAARVTEETGKPLAEAMGVDVLCLLDAAKWTARHGPRVLAARRLRLTNPLFLGRRSLVEREPLGVVGIVSPWNYPLAIPGANVLHALMAGNAVVLKPASFTPRTALMLQALLVEAGVPADVFQVVVGSGRVTGQALVDADVDHLIFTGSVPVGHQVERELRGRGVSTCMELGGSDPAIVLADAPWPDAVRGIVWARFTNAGQTCAAVKRALVQRPLYDRFVAEAVRMTQALRVGDPTDAATEVGPLTDPRAVEEMVAFVEDARKRGAHVLCGGKARPDLGPQFFEPTVLSDVPLHARVMTEETFGPILPIAAFDTEEEALRIANATPFGLSASVWTRDLARGEALARRIEAGTVVVNDAAYTFAAHETPWGGFKDSGHGRTHGEWGLLELTRLRHVNVVPARRPVEPFWWFPYGRDLRDTFEKGAQYLYGSTGRKATVAPSLVSRLLRRR